jgi:hypothetical protein
MLTVDRDQWCRLAHIKADDVEAYVWSKIVAALEHPRAVVEYFIQQSDAVEEQREEILKQLNYLQRQIAICDEKTARWNEAFEE